MKNLWIQIFLFFALTRFDWVRKISRCLYELSYLIILFSSSNRLQDKKNICVVNLNEKFSFFIKEVFRNSPLWNSQIVLGFSILRYLWYRESDFTLTLLWVLFTLSSYSKSLFRFAIILLLPSLCKRSNCWPASECENRGKLSTAGEKPHWLNFNSY